MQDPAAMARRSRTCRADELPHKAVDTVRGPEKSNGCDSRWFCWFRWLRETRRWLMNL